MLLENTSSLIGAAIDRVVDDHVVVNYANVESIPLKRLEGSISVFSTVCKQYPEVAPIPDIFVELYSLMNFVTTVIVGKCL